MPLPREKAKCHHQILEGVGEGTVWLELNLGNLRRLHGISQWVTQNPKATITSPAAATLPKLLSAIPALHLWEKPRGEGLIPPAPRQLLPGKGIQVLSAGKVSGMPWGGQGSEVGKGLT